MDYQGTIIRPPSEANSIILQVTVGCSHNRCTFCGAYKDVVFQLKDPLIINQDIDFAARYCQRQHRVFLADGDVLILPQTKLVTLLTSIRSRLPWVKRVSLYANAKSIRAKSDSQLRQLQSLGLDRVYMGLESGHDPTLAAINKGATSNAMIEAGQKVRDAGLFLSITVLLGIAGREYSLAHAVETGRALSAMAPNQIGVLTLMLLHNTPLYQAWKSGSFQLPDQPGLLRELRCLVESIDCRRVQFMSNHASNYLPINARLPRDKQTILTNIDRALAGALPLVPEHVRAL